ncbi:MAG: peptidoglycan-binding protein [Enhydrobacter sp.]|nr:MAG: peptidoglycan-binding protein [Enhydrobacter sp.]
MATFKLGDSGPGVKRLQTALQKAGFNPGIVDGDFGPGTQAAVIAFQKGAGLVHDGVAGVRTQAALGMIRVDKLPDITGDVTVQKVALMFPGTFIGNIKTHLPNVTGALAQAGIGDRLMVLMALGTIRAETAQFVPISEGLSQYNTSPNGHPFDLYDNRGDLGNKGKPDGDRFKGRGFVQLTGRSNYRRIGKALGVGLEANPELGNDSVVAGRILAAFLKAVEIEIKVALLDQDLKTARRLVNGGSHGLDEFVRTYRLGEQQFPAA